MIIKLIPGKAKPEGAERYARYLTRYLATADRRLLRPDAVGVDYGLTLSAYMAGLPSQPPPSERVRYRGAFVAGAPRAWDEGVAETQRRLDRRSRKVKKPVRHAVMSCRDGESLSEEQSADAVAMLAKELGCEEAAILWAVHADTDNFHIHVMIVTIDGRTGAALPFGQEVGGRAGYKEAMQRAIARIEHVHQLQAEIGARYEMQGGEPVRKPLPKQPCRKRTPLRQDALEFEEASGFASFTRVAQEVAGPLLDEAVSWIELHCGLARHGIGIRPRLNGGELYAGDEHVKLSNVDRRHSLGKLEDRLGPFEPPTDLEISSYSPRILNAAEAERWLELGRRQRSVSEQMGRRVAFLMAARDVAVADSDARLSDYRADLAGFDGDARVRQDLSASWPRLRAAATAKIRSAFNARIAAVRALWASARASDGLDAVDIDALGEIDVGIVAPWYVDLGPRPIASLAAFDGERSGAFVRYWKQDDSVRQGRPALVDTGAIIWVNDQSDRAIEAALVLAQERFGAVAVFGDAAYLDRCRRVADRVGIQADTITVGEAQRRARRFRQHAASTRERAVAEHRNHQAGTAARLAWARAYRRAGADVPDWDEPALPTEVPHRHAIATVATMPGSPHSSGGAASARRMAPAPPDRGPGR